MKGQSLVFLRKSHALPLACGHRLHGAALQAYPEAKVMTSFSLMVQSACLGVLILLLFYTLWLMRSGRLNAHVTVRWILAECRCCRCRSPLGTAPVHRLHLGVGRQGTSRCSCRHLFRSCCVSHARLPLTHFGPNISDQTVDSGIGIAARKHTDK